MKDVLKFAVKLTGSKLVKNSVNDARRIGSSTTKKG